MDPRIADFIARNHGKYTQEAIRQQLIEAGHDPADIDATWAALFTPDPDETSVAGEGFWPRFFLFLVGLNVAVFLVVASSTGMLENLGGGGGALAGIFAVALGVGALIAWGIVAAVGPAKLGRTTAIIIGAVIPLVFAILVGGSCFALASAIGPPPPPPVNGELEITIDGPTSFQASGPATCQPTRDSIGFSVYGSDIGQLDGAPLYVGVDAYEESPGDLITSVSMQALGATETEYREWFTSPETEVTADVSADGLSGTVTFSRLTEGFPEGPPPGAAADALSGTIRWSCG